MSELDCEILRDQAPQLQPKLAGRILLHRQAAIKERAIKETRRIADGYQGTNGKEP